MPFDNSTVSNISEEERQKKIELRKAELRKKTMLHGGGNYYPENERVELPLDLIDPNPDNSSIFNMDMIEVLANTIKNEGFKGVIEVYAKPEGRYEISAGHRRYEAAKLLQMKTIPAIIYPYESDERRALRLVTSNSNNRYLSPCDIANMIEYYIQKCLIDTDYKGDKIEACIKQFGKSRTQIKRYRSLIKFSPDIQSLTKDSNFPFTSLDSARSFTPEEQEELYSRILNVKLNNEENNISGIEVIDIINKIKAKKEVAAQNIFEQNALTSKDEPVEANLESGSDRMVRKGPLNNVDVDTLLSEQTEEQAINSTSQLLADTDKETENEDKPIDISHVSSSESFKHVTANETVSGTYILKTALASLSSISSNILIESDSELAYDYLNKIILQAEQLKSIIKK